MAEMQKSGLQKRGRKRNKNLFSQIRDQMEFYFGDANLQKDRFLKQKINESADGYVDLEMFLRFNKIRQLVTDVSYLARALIESPLLQLNDEKTKVRRTAPFVERQDVDERTVYVEHLPPGANHEWIKNAFSSCGRVVYVSLPKYRSTSEIKGFAFVEFETVDAAHTACQTMNNPPALGAEQPIARLPKNKDLKRLERQWQSHQGRKRRASDSIVVEDDKLRAAKRRRTVSEGSDKVGQNGQTRQRNGVLDRSDTSASDISPCKEQQDSQSPNKVSGRQRQKVEDPGGCGEKGKRKGKRLSGERDSTGSKTEHKRKRTRLNESHDQQEEAVAAGGVEKDSDGTAVVEMLGVDKDGDDSRRKVFEDDKDTEQHTRSAETEQIEKGIASVGHDLTGKHAKKVKICDKPEKMSEILSETKGHRKSRKKRPSKNRSKTKDIPELRVISKCEWLQLRSEYLSQQKASMAQLKESLKAFKQKSGSGKCQSRPLATTKVETDTNVDQEVSTGAVKENQSSLVFTPNVIVRITSEQPLTRKELRSQLSSRGSVVYVDVQDGETLAHVRCSDALSASAITETHLSGCTLQLLTGEDEQNYWTKATADRQKKFDKKEKKSRSRPKRRGRDKVLQQAERVRMSAESGKHIVFDD